MCVYVKYSSGQIENYTSQRTGISLLRIFDNEDTRDFFERALATSNLQLDAENKNRVRNFADLNKLSRNGLRLKNVSVEKGRHNSLLKLLSYKN